MINGTLGLLDAWCLILRSIFFNCLRPKILLNWRHKGPLCSDAFSGWLMDRTERYRLLSRQLYAQLDREIENKRVYEATQYLHQVVIPKFANALEIFHCNLGIVGPGSSLC